MTAPDPTTFHEFVRLCAIIRKATGLTSVWAIENLKNKWPDQSWRPDYHNQWRCYFSVNDREEIIRRWTIYKLEK